MKWKIWPRQYGKTHQLREWWLEDPANRVILMESVMVARYHQGVLLSGLEQVYPGNTHQENRRLVRTRILSYRTWINGDWVDRDLKKCQVAVDGLDYILPKLLKAHIVYAAGCGTNDVPDPQQANDVEEFHKQTREKFGVDWDA